MTVEGTAARPVPDPEEDSGTNSSPVTDERLSTLLDALGRKIAVDGGNLDSVLERIAIAAQSFTGASGAAIALRQGEDVVCRARSGESAPPLGTQLDANSGISGECLRTGEPILVEDTEADPRVDAEVCRSLELRSMALVALSRDGVAEGVLEVFATEPETFDHQHVAALQQLARLVLMATAPPGTSQRQEAPRAPAMTASTEPTATPLMPPIQRYPAPGPQPPAPAPPVTAKPVVPATAAPPAEKRVLAPVIPARPVAPAAGEPPASGGATPAKPETPAASSASSAPAPVASAAPKAPVRPREIPAPQFKAAQMQSGGSAFFSALKAAWFRPLPLTVLFLIILGVVYYLFYRG